VHRIRVRCGIRLERRRRSGSLPDAPRLFPLIQDGKWGYVDSTGKWIVVPQYDYAHEFADGMAAVKIGEQWGYVDSHGQLRIRPQYTSFRGFSDGLATVEVGGQDVARRVSIAGRWGFIDKQGKFVIPPSFYYTRSFGEGLAAVALPSGFSGKWGFIDRTGTFVIEPQFTWAWQFRGGIAGVVRNGELSYIRKNGAVAFTVNGGAGRGFDFTEGLAAVDGPLGKMGFIDTTGTWIIKADFDYAREFQGSLAAVRVGPHWGYINKSGEFVFQLRR
jgi:hypothetical protein